MIFFYLLILVIFILFINKFLLYKNILISETGDIHQKFASKSSVPLTGGLFIFLGYLYFLNEKNFVFSSELRSLLKYPKIHKILNKNSILNYLHYDAFVGDQTIIKDCYKLEPASYLIYDLSTNSLKIKKYWKVMYL